MTVEPVLGVKGRVLQGLVCCVLSAVLTWSPELSDVCSGPGSGQAPDTCTHGCLKLGDQVYENLCI